MKKVKGFTLIELMIVVAIIGILAAIAIPRFAQLIDKAREAGARGNLGAIRSSVAIYYGDNKGVWPIKLDGLDYTIGGETFPKYIPNYMSKVPKATLQRSISKHGNNTALVTYVFTEPNAFISANQITNKGGWMYSSRSGDCRINCNERDTVATTITNSTLYYSNYGHEEP